MEEDKTTHLNGEESFTFHGYDSEELDKKVMCMFNWSIAYLIPKLTIIR